LAHRCLVFYVLLLVENEAMIVQAARESEELYRVYQTGIAEAMEAVS
jgi:hypothetical protein